MENTEAKFLGQQKMMKQSVYDPDMGARQIAFKDELGFNITQDHTGFRYPSDMNVIYNKTNRTITLTGNVEGYHQGTKVTELVNGWVSPQHSATSGTYYLYYNGTNFVWSYTPWEFYHLMIAYIQFNGYQFALRECHGLMQWQSHKEFHETIGTYRKSGGDISGYVLNSNVAGNRRPDIASLLVYDEDLPSTLPLLNTKKYTHRYLSGTGSRTFDIQQDDIIKTSGTLPQYNLFSGGTWSIETIPNNNYAAVFIVGIPVTADSDSQEYRYVWMQPQQYGTLSAIQALTPNSINLGDSAMLVSEFVFFGKIIILSTGNNRQLYSVELIAGTKTNQTSTGGNFLSIVNHDTSLSGAGTAGSPLSVVRTWNDYISQWTAEPVSYDIQPTYEVLEYTYGNTKLYRKIPNTYNPSQDIFYAEPSLTTVVATRALSLT